MTPDRWQQIEHLLDEVLACAAEERAAFLDDACGDDIALRREVEALLAAEEVAPAFLDADAVAFAAPALDGMPVTTVAGRRVGPYRLVREVGHGGMGVVYLAEREDVGRQVALKLVRGGLADPGATERFLFEQRVLARLEHPHIARLYDVGVTTDRSPYFAMEYIEGQPLNVYCDAHHLGIEARLRLFETVGQAVQHAHQHFVVHRDLKPSNILVTEDDAGRPQVKLLDFGIAKMMADAEEGAPAQTLTAAGHRLMTPAYAAPEQIKGEAVTAMTDVYSLGVVLYELLTGQRPYEATGPGAAQAVLTQEPKRPSTAITGERTGTITETAEARATTAERLRRRLRGDLDVICLKALQKEPERRYASAEAFVEDIKRHLAGLPVTARPDTVSYRFRKFARRHRTGVVITAAGILLLALVVGFYTVRVQEERDVAQREAERATQVTQFLIDVFGEASPDNALGDTLNAFQILERGVTRLETEMVGQPAQQAAIQDAIGLVYRDLGAYDKAESLIASALQTRERLYGHDHPDVAASLASMGKVYFRQGVYEKADSVLQEALAIIEASYGTAHPQWVEYLNIQGQVLIGRGEYEEAESVLKQALKTGLQVHGRRHEEVAFSYDYLARAFREQGDYEAALPLNQEALAIARALYGGNHPHVTAYLSNLGSIYFNMGQDSTAEQYQREALALNLELLGEDHPDIAINYTNVASSVRNQGRSEEAIVLYRKAEDIMRHTYGDAHPNLAALLYNLGNALRDIGKYDEAEPVLREMLAIDEESLGPDHPLVGTDKHMLAALMRDKEAYAEALILHQEAVALLRKKLPPDHRHVGHALAGYGITLSLVGNQEEAETQLRAGIAVLNEAYTADHWSVADARAWLGACLTRQQRYEEAERLLLEGYEKLNQDRGSEDIYTRKAAQHLAALYEAWGQPAKAAEYRAVLNKEG